MSTHATPSKGFSGEANAEAGVSLYTLRELEHQLKDSGGEAIVVLENFAHTVERVLPLTAVKHVIVATMGDLLGFKGVIVNLVVRRVKKMVPTYSLPGAVAFNDALSAGRNVPFSKPKIGPDDVAFLQYRRHHRCLQGRDPAPS